MNRPASSYDRSPFVVILLPTYSACRFLWHQGFGGKTVKSALALKLLILKPTVDRNLSRSIMQSERESLRSVKHIARQREKGTKIEFVGLVLDW